MKIQLLISFFTLSLFSCNVENTVSLIDVDALIIHEKIYSPDSSKYLIRYSLDEGALGSCCNRTSILKSLDSLKEITNHIIPFVFENLTWQNNNELYAEIRMLPYLTMRGNFDPTFPELKVSTVNDVKINKTFYNKVLQTDSRKILLKKLSPSKELELIWYTYKPRKYLNDSITHISIIPTGNQIPLNGNLYIIGKNLNNQIKSINWVSINSISFYITKGPKYYGQLDFCEVSKTTSYQKIVNGIKKEIYYK